MHATLIKNDESILEIPVWSLIDEIEETCAMCGVEVDNWEDIIFSELDLMENISNREEIIRTVNKSGYLYL